MQSHPETFLPADKLGSVYPSYHPTFDRTDRLMETRHAWIRNAVSTKTGLLSLTAPGLLDNSSGDEIAGFLRIDDALKLYEIAYCSSGDVLELGTYCGLSTCLTAQAIIDSGRRTRLTTIDIEHRAEAEANMRACAVQNQVDYIIFEGTAAISKLGAEGRRFGFAFIDHAHDYEPVRSACALLENVLQPGSFVLFHDWNDPRNGVEPQYDVYRAVKDGLPGTFDFYGVYGCTALYRLNR
jgi:hypothetical protein